MIIPLLFVLIAYMRANYSSTKIRISSVTWKEWWARHGERTWEVLSIRCKWGGCRSWPWDSITPCTLVLHHYYHIMWAHSHVPPPPSLLFYYWANKYTHSQGWIHYPNPLFIIFLLLHFCPLNINSFGKLDCLLFSRKEKEKKVGPKLKKSGNVVGKCTHTHTGHRNWNTKY